MAKPKEKPFKRKAVKPKKEKKNPLDSMCNEEQRTKLKEIAARGGVVICTGSLPMKNSTRECVCT